MQSLAAEQKRNRRTYTLRADDAIFAAFAKYPFLTCEQASRILGRGLDTVQKRFKVLYQAGLLNRVQESLIQPFVYFLDREGAKRACDLGELAKPRCVMSKSRLIVNHDLEISTFHLCLETALNGKPGGTGAEAGGIGNHPGGNAGQPGGRISEWRQWRDDLRDKVETDQGSKSIIPDAYFTLGDKAFFLEIVKSYESEYVGGRSNIEQKLSLYHSYKARFQEKYGLSDFRVLWVLPTIKRVQMLLGKIEDEFPFRRFWFTDEAAYKRDILGKIWWTPKDFRDRTYSIFGQES